MQQKIRLANGYTFNRVINGCWQLSAEHNLQGKTDVDDALQGFHELVEHGFTTFDCADIYTGVEEIIGRFVNELKATGHYQEEDIQVHTKFVPDKSMLSKVDRKYVERIIDRSLQRMHREAIDLVQFHWWDFNVAGMMDTAFELARLQKKGKIRNIGMCNMDTERLKPVSTLSQIRPSTRCLTGVRKDRCLSIALPTIFIHLPMEHWLVVFYPRNT